ncbi:MAG: ATP-binding cassette domain-containing protein [Actinomycetia bacterium]|nr:ATP-binding cassette domain-containing protein [Actinomycetes bacterium]
MLTAEDLTFAYPHGQHLLSLWNAEFRPGAITAVVAQPGRGSSTVLALLGLLLRPQSGRILLAGTDVGAASDAARADLRAGTFGYVFDEPLLDAGRTVAENILAGAAFRDQARGELESATRSLLARFDLAPHENAPAAALTPDQQQLVAVCRALLSAPPIILADEPTRALSNRQALSVLHALSDHADAGGTVVIATADERVAEGCDERIDL